MSLFKGAWQFKTRKPHNALESELQALLGAMMVCWSQGHTKVIFEGDNANVINLITRKTKNIDVLNWLRDIWEWEQRFETIQHVWINRGYNSCRGGQKTQTEPNRTNQTEVKPNKTKPCSLCNPIGSCFTQPERFGLVWV